MDEALSNVRFIPEAMPEVDSGLVFQPWVKTRQEGTDAAGVHVSAFVAEVRAVVPEMASKPTGEAQIQVFLRIVLSGGRLLSTFPRQRVHAAIVIAVVGGGDAAGGGSGPDAAALEMVSCGKKDNRTLSGNGFVFELPACAARTLIARARCLCWGFSKFPPNTASFPLTTTDHLSTIDKANMSATTKTGQYSRNVKAAYNAANLDNLPSAAEVEQQLADAEAALESSSRPGQLAQSFC